MKLTLDAGTLVASSFTEVAGAVVAIAVVELFLAHAAKFTPVAPSVGARVVVAVEFVVALVDATTDRNSRLVVEPAVAEQPWRNVLGAEGVILPHLTNAVLAVVLCALNAVVALLLAVVADTRGEVAPRVDDARVRTVAHVVAGAVPLFRSMHAPDAREAHVGRETLAIVTVELDRFLTLVVRAADVDRAGIAVVALVRIEATPGDTVERAVPRCGIARVSCTRVFVVTHDCLEPTVAEGLADAIETSIAWHARTLRIIRDVQALSGLAHIRRA